MNTKYIRSSMAVLSILVLIHGSQAQAGFLNWASKSQDTTSNDSLSFTDLYATITSIAAPSKDLPTIQSNSVMEMSSHTTPATPARVSKVRTYSTQKTYVVSASAYSSTPDQTDDSPFITARGTYVRDGIVAANFLPFGTLIKIPAMYGDKIFVVEDRMNKRYWLNVDVWFADRQSAMQFGRRTITIEVVS